jgi:hypothetical protein
MHETLSTTEIKIARQFLSPNTRAEVDRALNLNMPLHPPLAELIRAVLRDYHERIRYGITVTE